jgi:OOP family OmpA-OmpF porin
MRIEADRYRMHDGVGGQANVNVYSASLVIPFGRELRRTARAPSPVVAMAEPKATPPVMVAPVVVAAPPAPPPVLAPLPAPRRVSFSAESLFGFDRAELQPAGMEALDGFARDAAGASFEVVVVQGHADRSGPAAYNQVLSLARADAVKAYLVSHGGFQASRISTAGMGETQPVTKPGDCPASMTGAKLHTCLQADRRVDVELSGTR